MQGNKALAAGIIAVGLAVALSLAATASAQMWGWGPSNPMGPNFGWGVTPPRYGAQYGSPYGGGMMGSGMMGGGMMGSGGGMMGGGMMGAPSSGAYGWGTTPSMYGHQYSGGMMGDGCSMMGGGMMGGYSYSPYASPSTQPLTIDQAVDTTERYLASLGNPDLAVEEVEEYTQNFYAVYYEKSTGIGAFEMLIDKNTGIIRPEPGPNMMWNTKYGMMGSYGVPTADMPITRDQAVTIAQNYLNTYLPAATVKDVHTFYGYYTIMVSFTGETYGMLSVNGYNGQVWYHTWHGVFLQEKKIE